MCNYLKYSSRAFCSNIILIEFKLFRSGPEEYFLILIAKYFYAVSCGKVRVVRPHQNGSSVTTPWAKPFLGTSFSHALPPLFGQWSVSNSPFSHRSALPKELFRPPLNASVSPLISSISNSSRLRSKKRKGQNKIWGSKPAVGWLASKIMFAALTSWPFPGFCEENQGDRSILGNAV